MNKLSAPVINNIIPAMQKDLLSNDDIVLTIGFQIDDTTSINAVQETALMIKTVNANIIKLQDYRGGFYKNNFTSMYEASFMLKASDWITGQYYKVQLALVNEEGVVGYYSNMGVVKCISKPSVFIQNVKSGIHLGEYIGVYQTNDLDEKVYSYCFTIYDGNEIYDTSNIQLHNSNLDSSRQESTDMWVPKKSLVQNKQYRIQYEVTTINGAKIKSSIYPIEYIVHGDPPVNNGCFCGLFFGDDAYVNLHLRPINNIDTILQPGTYVISRASDEDEFQNWIELFRFNFKESVSNVHFGNDYTIAQGIEYKYKIQQIYSNGAYSTPMEAIYYLNSYNSKIDNLCIEFEHAYLFDGEKQLCIKYNPKISSFKTTMLESKMDTLGGKYPFIFKNGNVSYKEFPISGLISALMDSNHTFNNGTGNDYEAGQDKNSATFISANTSLECQNFRVERDFKTQVLNWLTNGSIKLFRSPGEGNFIVRLMNTSLTPNDTLSRMLHTFNCTAYEIADYTISNLKLYNFIKQPNNSDIIKTLLYREYNLQSIFAQRSLSYSLSSLGGSYYLEFRNQFSDLEIQTVHMSGKTSSFNIGNATGTYFIQKIESDPIIQLKCLAGNIDNDSIVVVGYYKELQDDNTHSIHLFSRDIAQQFIGSKLYNQKNLIDIIKQDTNIFSIGKFYLIQAMPKTVIKVAYKDSAWHLALVNFQNNEILISSAEIDTWDSSALYYDINNNEYYCGQCTDEYLIGDEVSFDFILNGDQTILASCENGDIINRKDWSSISNVNTVSNLQIGDGIICNVIYQCDYNSPLEDTV